jgi:DNA-binding NtrC family response regulator
MVFCKDSKNVLVLEDYEGIRFALEEMIEKLGFVVYSCESRGEFLEIYRSVFYFAVILDNSVSYVKGGFIKKNIGASLGPQLLRREPELRVGLHTGDDISERLDEFQKIGLVYLPKPVSIASLREFLIVV